MPVLIVATFNDDGTPDAMTAAWGGIHDTNQVGICIAGEHKTAENLLHRKAFTVSFADAAHIKACDYAGCVSGKDIPDKVSKAGFSVTASSFVDAPVINELPVCLECELVSYDITTGCMVGNIINVSAEDTVLTDGKIDIEKLDPVLFDPVHAVYRKTGPVVAGAFCTKE